MHKTEKSDSADTHFLQMHIAHLFIVSSWGGNTSDNIQFSVISAESFQLRSRQGYNLIAGTVASLQMFN